MRILYLAEDNSGGGAKAILNLVLASSKFAEVGFLGSDSTFQKLKEMSFFEAKAERPISLKYFWGVCNSLRSFKPDIVHANGMYTGLIALLARSSRKLKFKIIMTLHHTSDKYRFNFLAKKLVPVLNKIDVIHYLTEYQREFYLEFGLNPFNFRIIPNITFTPSYSEDNVKALRTELIVDTSAERLIVYVGRLVESKQLNVFIEVIKKINQLNFNVGGIIVGTGDTLYTTELKKIASNLEVDSKILFTGFSKQPELYIKASDFCLFPTQHSEALPLFILETFSQQKSMVVSNHPSISNIVEDNVDSIVSTIHSSDAYAEKCIELLKNPQILRNLEMGALNKFNDYYKPEKVINEFEKMYLEVIK